MQEIKWKSVLTPNLNRKYISFGNVVFLQTLLMSFCCGVNLGILIIHRLKELSERIVRAYCQSVERIYLSSSQLTELPPF